ncbi:pilus assembly protein TadG-related protein [Streptomyces sp. JH14]|uniref:pilus assembly protein TadG-related protein n=1 Tax=Streptomyces sp. JH14 TaxID=2793630 RepID=UPI0023F9C5A5|nr:pilus assembly protein TadG-related protein [Streptomyces sp. JH14]MDF6044538.1 pilus assembly protein TadG-related protein [Streptomyces sp. JH14]
MTAKPRGDAGQAFPIYVVMVAGLLFLAFAFFAVGKASATRNGAQGAADAAALAAAQDARDGLGPPFISALMTNTLDEFLRDYRFTPYPCVQAQRLASANRADLDALDPKNPGGCNWGYGYLQDKVTASVKTRYTIGDTVIPGTETRHATADATAVIEFRCGYKFKGDPGDPVNFKCDGRDGFSIDPTDFDQGSWAALSKAIFAVHLVDD